jgi:hypothetical protein
VKILFEERKKIATESLAEGNAQIIIKLNQAMNTKINEEKNIINFNQNLFIKPIFSS